MQLSDVLNTVEDSERGATLELRHPVSGAPTGMKLTLAGPDSRRQRDSRISMMDEIAEAARPDGTIPADARERAAVASLARCIITWEMAEDGQLITLTHEAAVRLLSVQWCREQADSFAGNRSNFIRGSA